MVLGPIRYRAGGLAFSGLIRYDRSSSSSRIQILSQDPRVAGCNTQKGHRRTFRPSPPLLPVAQSMNADAHGLGKLLLSQIHEAPQGRDVLTGVEIARDEPAP